MGSLVTLCAIFQPTGRSDGPAVMDLTVSNLHLNAQRITNFCWMIRLSSLIKPISQTIGFRWTPEFETIKRYVFGTIAILLWIFFSRDNKTIELSGKCVRKEYFGHNRHLNIQKLKSVYKLLREKQVPNTDSLVTSHSDEGHGAVVYLGPRGICCQQDSPSDILDAVICILEALEVSVHSIPYPSFM